MAEDTAEGLKDAIRVETAELRGHVDAVVRSSVEETLKALRLAKAAEATRGTRIFRTLGVGQRADRQGRIASVPRGGMTSAVLAFVLQQR